MTRFTPSTFERPNFPAFWQAHGSAVLEVHEGLGRLGALQVFADELDRLKDEIGADGSFATPDGEVHFSELDVDATLAARIVEGARDAYRVAVDWTAGIASAPRI